MRGWALLEVLGWCRLSGPQASRAVLVLVVGFVGRTGRLSGFPPGSVLRGLRDRWGLNPRAAECKASTLASRLPRRLQLLLLRQSKWENEIWVNVRFKRKQVFEKKRVEGRDILVKENDHFYNPKKRVGEVDHIYGGFRD